MVMEKTPSKYLIIDVACPIDKNLTLKRNEKLDNYSELRLEIARMLDKETLIVSIIIGALGSILNDLEYYLKKLGILYNVGTLQKSVLLGIVKHYYCQKYYPSNNKNSKIVGGGKEKNVKYKNISLSEDQTRT